MSKIWGKMVACGSDIQKRKSAIQELYTEIMTLAPGNRLENSVWIVCFGDF